jgi:hypothetical protein
VDTLLGRIASRGRGFEASIPREYLASLNTLYEEWINSFTQCPVLIIPSDNLNLVAREAHIAQVVQLVQDRLMGKTEITL